MTTRILLADGHPLTLSGLAEALDARAGFEVVGRAENGISAPAPATGNSDQDRGLSLLGAEPHTCLLDVKPPGAAIACRSLGS